MGKNVSEVEKKGQFQGNKEDVESNLFVCMCISHLQRWED